MTEATIARPPAGASPLTVNVPPGPRLPRLVQGVGFLFFRRGFTGRIVRRYGDVATMNLPVFGHMVTVADPQLAKQLFTASTDEVGNVQPNLSRLFGSGSVFALDGADHRRRRKLLTPPFHGKSIKNYEKIFEEETLREAASWPDGQEFETLEPMMRITLNVILRAVFGADGERLDELRDIIPPWVTLGSKLAMAPKMPERLKDFGPWGRLAGYRRRYDAVVGRLIDDIEAHGTEDRDDVLTLLLRSTYEDGSAMSRREIADELLTLLAAGHETTASTLAWTFERISRHPAALAALVAEAATTDNAYRQATILEVQRVRTVIDAAARHVYAPTFEVGEWVVPRGYSIRVDISRIHQRSQEFPDPGRFDPQRFIGERPSTFAWLPFGGGTRRCVGAAFANVEMDVVLRTVLRHYVIDTSTAPDEKVHCRGVAFTPKKGGRVVLRRRHIPLA